MYLIKAKRAPVGTIRKRKSGRWIKDRPDHWRLLHEIVSAVHQDDGLHQNHSAAKLMHRAAKDVIRYASKHRNGYSRPLAKRYLEMEYGHHGYMAPWYNATLNSVEKYFKQMQNAYEGKSTQHSATSIKEWRESLATASLDLRTDSERDQWVSTQFMAKKKPISHILVAAREFLGGKHMSTVPDTGFIGLCKAIINKVYEHGPSGLSKEQIEIWDKAFRTVLFKTESGDDSFVPLQKALTKVNSKAFFRQNPKWFVYCAVRYAGKNDGMVNMSHIESYMKNAMKKHGTKNPPRPDYDDKDGLIQSQVRLGMLTPNQAVKQYQQPTSQKEKIKKLYLKNKRLKKSEPSLKSSVSACLALLEAIRGGSNE
jgi:hypothetical protein